MSQELRKHGRASHLRAAGFGGASRTGGRGGKSGVFAYAAKCRTGNTTARPAGDLTAGGYTLFNVGATYVTKIGGYGVTFRAAIDNIMNRRYGAYQYADYISPGDPRTLSLNARIDF